MSRRPKTEPIETSGAKALTHNPFLALAAAPLSTEEPPPAALPSVTDAPIRFAQKVVVRRETKGRGGKTVTRIAGLPASHRAELAASMKKALGCGALVEGEDVILLGSVVDRAAEWLAAEGAARIVRSG